MQQECRKQHEAANVRLTLSLDLAKWTSLSDGLSPFFAAVYLIFQALHFQASLLLYCTMTLWPKHFFKNVFLQVYKPQICDINGITEPSVIGITKSHTSLIEYRTIYCDRCSYTLLDDAPWFIPTAVNQCVVVMGHTEGSTNNHCDTEYT